MKQIITILLLSITTVILAQDNVLVIYIDASEAKENLIEIQDDVKQLIANKPNHKLFLFISNGLNPFLTNKSSEAGKILNRLRIGSRPAPDHTFDTKELNKAMLENQYISNINNITQSDGLENKIEIHVYTAKVNKNTIELKLVEPFLYSNRLKHAEKNQINCSVEYSIY